MISMFFILIGESQNDPSWKWSIKIIKSNLWLYTGPPKIRTCVWEQCPDAFWTLASSVLWPLPWRDHLPDHPDSPYSNIQPKPLLLQLRAILLGYITDHKRERSALPLHWPSCGRCRPWWCLSSASSSLDWTTQGTSATSHVSFPLDHNSVFFFPFKLCFLQEWVMADWSKIQLKDSATQ